VWADDPPGRPALATPVKLSYLAGAELAKRRTITWAALEQMDAAIVSGRDPSNAVAFGVLIAPFIHFTGDAEPRAGVLQGAINEVSQPLITQLHVTPPRPSERLRYLLIAQRRLSAARRRNVQAELSGGRELIDDATLLYTLLERAPATTPRCPRPSPRRKAPATATRAMRMIRISRASAAAAGAVAGVVVPRRRRDQGQIETEARRQGEARRQDTGSEAGDVRRRRLAAARLPQGGPRP